MCITVSQCSVSPTHATNHYYLLYGPDPGLYFYCQQNVSARRCSVSECLSSMILKWLLFSVLLVDARIKWYFIRISFLLWNDWRWSEFSESLLEFSDRDIAVHRYTKYSGPPQIGTHVQNLHGLGEDNLPPYHNMIPIKYHNFSYNVKKCLYEK